MTFGFLNALMLVGLAGVAIPVVIHLLNRRRFDTVDWGVMQFLQISETKLRGMCRAGSIPFHKVDGSYRFDLDELYEATRARPRLEAAS